MILDDALQHVELGGVLRRADVERIFGVLLDGEGAHARFAELLVALAARGESPAEIAGAADALSARLRPFEHGAPDAIDVQAEDDRGTSAFDVALAASIVAAGAGARVAHRVELGSVRSLGVRALAALEMPVDLDHARARRCLDAARVTLVRTDGAIGRLADVRDALAVRTLIDLAVVVCHITRGRRCLIGERDPHRADATARALRELGCERAYVVDAAGAVRAVGDAPAWDGTVSPRLVDSADAGLRVGDAGAHAAALLRLLDGARGPIRDAVTANAAAALVIAGVARDASDGVARAAASIDRREARRTLDLWIETARGT